MQYALPGLFEEMSSVNEMPLGFLRSLENEMPLGFFMGQTITKT